MYVHQFTTVPCTTQHRAEHVLGRCLQLKLFIPSTGGKHVYQQQTKGR